MDVIACQRAGIAGVAPLGTALTEEQMEALWRLHPEPTLCFDADAAGGRAASRAIDRALPLLKPGRSFRFASLSGGKDADDVLREQGAAALKTQLGQTTPMVEALFLRERDLEPLDTPERRTAFKSRLRRAAQAIADKELADAYRQELLARFDAAFGQKPEPPAAAMGPRRGRGAYDRRGFGPPAPTTAEARTAASRLSSRPHPVCAAAAKMVLEHPDVLEGHLEEVEAIGFGDPALAELAKEIIRLRLEGDVLDTGALGRHLATKGFGGLLSEVDLAAKRAALSFLDPDLPLAAAKSLWANAFDVLTRLSAIEDALAAAKARLETRRDMEAIEGLKAERDALRRSIGWGTDWTDRSARDG